MTISPAVKRPVWQERKPAIVSQRTPRTRAAHRRLGRADPDAAPRAVAAARGRDRADLAPALEDHRDRRRGSGHCTKRPKSLVPDARCEAGVPSAARTSARELPRRAPAIPRSTWISASAAAGAPRGASSAAAGQRHGAR